MQQDKYIVDLNNLTPWNGDVPSYPGSFAVVILHERFNVKSSSSDLNRPPKPQPTEQSKPVQPQTQQARKGRPPKSRDIEAAMEELDSQQDSGLSADNPFDDLDSIPVPSNGKIEKIKAAPIARSESNNGEFFVYVTLLGRTFRRKFKKLENAEAKVLEFNEFQDTVPQDALLEKISVTPQYEEVK